MYSVNGPPKLLYEKESMVSGDEEKMTTKWFKESTKIIRRTGLLMTECTRPCTEREIGIVEGKRNSERKET